MPTGPEHTEGRIGERVRTLYQEEARRALQLSAVLRFLVIFAVLTLGFETGESIEIMWLNFFTTLAFAPVGLLQLLMVWRRLNWAWPKYLFILADVALLAVVTFLPWPGDLTLAYPALISREAVIVYSFILLLLSTLYFSAWAIVWFAVCSLGAWLVAVGVLIQQPGVVTADDLPDGIDQMERLAFTLRPDFAALDRWIEELVLLLIVALGTALVVARMRGTAMRAARVERRRGNLARYFSPTVLDDLERRDLPLEEGRQVEAAILFADLRGYSNLTEDLPPTQVLALLRDFHGAMEEQVFAYGGSLEKYIGDALMASFGTAITGDHDASQALCCARAMYAALADVNARRQAHQQPPIAMGVGLHSGPVVTGDIGSNRNMSFATVGATVNLASRMQGLTRHFDCDIVISAEFEARLRREIGAAADILLSGFSDPCTVRVKGFAHEITVRHTSAIADPWQYVA